MGCAGKTAARPRLLCMRPLCSPHRCIPLGSPRSFWLFSQPLLTSVLSIMRMDPRLYASTVHPGYLICRLLFSFVSDLSSSRMTARAFLCMCSVFFSRGNSVLSRNPILIFRPCRMGLFLALVCSASALRAQGPAPETAPPLFRVEGLFLTIPFSPLGAPHSRRLATSRIPRAPRSPMKATLISPGVSTKTLI